MILNAIRKWTAKVWDYHRLKSLNFFAAAIGTLSLIPLTVGFAFACFNHANTESKPRYLIMPTYTTSWLTY